MTNFTTLDTFYVTSVAAEYDSGHVVWDSEIDLDVLNHFIALRCPFPANTCGFTEAWTTNPSLKTKNADEVEIIYVSPEKLKEAECNSLYEYVFGDSGEYQGRDSKGVYFSDGNIDQVSEALECFIEKKLPEELVAEYLVIFS